MMTIILRGWAATVTVSDTDRLSARCLSRTKSDIPQKSTSPKNLREGASRHDAIFVLFLLLGVLRIPSRIHEAKSV
jgi:hypothetical protein